METLNYEVLKKSGYDGYVLKDAPEKVLQFGEGNFLRAFVDYWFDLANEKADWNGKCVLVQPIAPGLAKMINEQEGLYTLYLRGSENGKKVDDKRVISSVSRCLNPYEKEDFDKMMAVAASDDLEIIVSNTTEAGIVYDPACKLEDVPASSFPGKLTQVLYHRYKAGKKGIIMLACELIDNNGKELLKCVNQYIEQWGLEDGFKKYVNEDCTFCGSLVDRIVPGRIRDPKEVAELEQLLAVVVDQLAGQHDDALLACLVAVVQHLGQLAGEAGCGHVLQLAGGVVDDACLGGVGNDDLKIVAGGDVHHLLKALLLIRVQAAGDAGDNALVIDLPAVFTAAQIQGVQTLLLVDHLGQAGGNGLDQNALAVPVGLLVGQIEPVIHERTQEVALAELQDLLRGVFQNIAVVAGFCKNFIIQGIHICFSLP